ncbi:MAG: helix-turn-helix domain-containing protein [Clostridiales bacterium]|nr:helix-turn-helix domain-containing protein [Clostridiales bacterium]
MKSFMALTESIDYIEQNLCEPFARGDIARHCHVSLSMLEKLFRYALFMSIKTYVTKRRMTQAAKDLVNTGMSVTDIAMKYQYNSAEVFTRTFRRVWNVAPSAFKDKWTFTGIFPRINYEYKEGDDLYMARKRVDMSDAYDFLREKRGSYVLCFDIQNLSPINAVSGKAGDLAILECAARINDAAGDDMLMMRIGGDEFALITGLFDPGKAKAVSEEVLSKNGGTFDYEGQKIPLSLYCGVTTIPETLRYSEFFGELHQTINDSKR